MTCVSSHSRTEICTRFLYSSRTCCDYSIPFLIFHSIQVLGFDRLMGFRNQKLTIKKMKKKAIMKNWNSQLIFAILCSLNTQIMKGINARIVALQLLMRSLHSQLKPVKSFQINQPLCQKQEQYHRLSFHRRDLLQSL